MISNSGHDERGKASGGQAGDQTGTEWQIRSWYNRPWDCVLRFPDKNVRKLIAKYARSAANNNMIGYNQMNRLSFWQALKESDYDPAKIKTKCDSDCSAGVTAIVKAVGHILQLPKLENLSPSNYTGSMRATFRASGFTVLTEKKYLTSDKYLVPGDILLNETHHTCINLDYGEKVKPYEGWVMDDKGWWYQLSDETYLKDGWYELDGKWYHFDSSGYMSAKKYIKSKNYETNGVIYYVDQNGIWDEQKYRWMQEGKEWWFAQVGGKWYARNEWAWIEDKWYYFDDHGYMVKGDQVIGGKAYHFEEDGSLS